MMVLTTLVCRQEEEEEGVDEDFFWWLLLLPFLVERECNFPTECGTGAWYGWVIILKVVEEKEEARDTEAVVLVLVVIGIAAE
jgi:hypothetical protein